MEKLRTDLTKPTILERRWTCTQCSYAYNNLLLGKCEVCDCLRTQPCTITVTEDRISSSSNGTSL